jgi:hypothetical protein
MVEVAALPGMVLAFLVAGVAVGRETGRSYTALPAGAEEAVVSVSLIFGI